MKVGFIGNMNNYPFILASYMKQQGYEVLFIVTETEKLCRPEFRYKNITVPYPAWIKDVSPLNVDFFSSVEETKKFNEIINQLNTCDYVFLNGAFIHYAANLAKPHFVILTGSDLLELADFKFAESFYKLKTSKLLQNGLSPIIKLVNQSFWIRFVKIIFTLFRVTISIKHLFFIPKNGWLDLVHLSNSKIALLQKINLQREAIKNALGFIHSPYGALKESDKLLSEIGVNENKRIMGLMIDETLSNYIEPIEKPVLKLFNIARFNWVKNKIRDTYFSQLDVKANDVMIKGIALFYNKYNTPLDILFIEKGDDVEETKKLIKELHIDHLVTWKSVLSQQEVHEQYMAADIVFDQLGDALVSMGGLEAMAVGRPLIANAKEEIFDNVLMESTQICNAKTEIDVFNWLEKLCLDANFRLEKGVTSRAFVLKHFSQQAVINRIHQKII